jgi:hypothetical protein
MLTETRHVQAGPGQLTIAHALTDDDAAGIRELVTATSFEYETIDNERFLADVAVIAHGLPRAVRETLNRARLDDRKHAIVISGNHLGHDLEPTPRHWSAADTSASRVSAFLVMINAALLGDAIGWAGQQDGRLITDVLPTPGQENSLLSCGSRTMLGWHTEDAFSSSRDLCFLDNRNVVHGREPFTPRYDGRDRWLKRVNVVSDLRRTRTDRRITATRIIG